MTTIVVGADVTKIDGFGDTVHLINITQETVQIQVIADAVFIAFKVGDIHRIEAHQRRPQADIGFCQRIARQIAMLSKDLFQPLERFKHFCDRFVVGFLAGGKSGFVDAIIHVVVNPAVQLVDFIAQCRRVEITGAGTVRVKRGIEHADDLRGFIADDGLIFLSHSTGTVTRPV